MSYREPAQSLYDALKTALESKQLDEEASLYDHHAPIAASAPYIEYLVIFAGMKEFIGEKLSGSKKGCWVNFMVQIDIRARTSEGAKELSGKVYQALWDNRNTFGDDTKNIKLLNERPIFEENVPGSPMHGRETVYRISQTWGKISYNLTEE